MINLKKFISINSDLALFAFDIRKKVFVQEQHVRAEDEFDEFEKFSQHYLAFHDGTPVGTARWRHTQNGIKLERFAVLEEFRSKKIGHCILKEILKDVVPFRKRIYLHAQLPAVKFYKRQKFIEEGEIFHECNIAHYTMNYMGKTKK
ncbi:MAG: GNAT family N-acetyltransferase [Bacteroidetes bacterium]|nr:GNAT family N-acetyltransferase [Bacteroidota bacterium]HET6244944.1 GNAT family N-acetyltransferase [Bacteroidia bacterium]